MTSFYWNDNKLEAQVDAQSKGYTKWAWFDTAEKVVDPLSYQAVYFKAGIIELERVFAKIMRENAPKWLC